MVVSERQHVAASQPGDLLLREDAALHHVLDVALLERTLLPGQRRWRSLSGAPRGRGRRCGRCGGHGDGGEAQVRGGSREEEESHELWRLAELTKAAESTGVLENGVAAPCRFPYLTFLFTVATDNPAPLSVVTDPRSG